MLRWQEVGSGRRRKSAQVRVELEAERRREAKAAEGVGSVGKQMVGLELGRRCVLQKW